MWENKEQHKPNFKQDRLSREKMEIQQPWGLQQLRYHNPEAQESQSTTQREI